VAFDLIAVPSLPHPAYNFDPDGWIIFELIERSAYRCGGSRYVAVSKRTGAVRDLGVLGE
jgi:hypothetical protein